MSTLYSQSIDCPACGTEFDARVAESLNVQRAAIARQWALDGTINLVVCPGCSADMRLEMRVQYVDLERGLWVFKFLPLEAGEVESREAVAERVFAETMAEGRAPHFIAAIPKRIRPRVCFTYPELFEKVQAAEQGVDDAVLEVLKHQLLQQEPSLLASGVRWVRLVAPERSGYLTFALYRAAMNETDPPAESTDGPEAVHIERSAYDELAAQRDELALAYPALFTAPYVSLERYRTVIAREAVGEGT